MQVEVVTSPGGIEAWLVEDRFVPAFTLHYGFDGGSAQDPAGKSGLAYLLGSILCDGLKCDATPFSDWADACGLRHSFYVGKDVFCGGLVALRENRSEAAGLLSGMLGQPPLDPTLVEIKRKHQVAGLATRMAKPDVAAVTQWDATAFPDHPYEHPVHGTLEALTSITTDDLDAYRSRIFAKDTLKVVCVGAISAAELGALLDDAFGELPATASSTDVPNVAMSSVGTTSFVELAVPQAAIVFGVDAVPRSHPDYSATMLLNHMLGGRHMSSRLVEEIRFKRGLAFDAGSEITLWRHAAVLRGVIHTRSAMVGQVLELIREEFLRLTDGAFAAADIDSAKRSLAATLALPPDDNRGAAHQLLSWSLAGVGPGYPSLRKRRIEVLSDYDVRRVARRMLDPQKLSVCIAGERSLRAAAG